MKNTKTTKIILFAALLTIGYSHTAHAMAKRPIQNTTPSETTPAPAPTPKPPQNPPPASGTNEVTPLWESKHTSGKEWTTFVNAELDRLGTDLLDVIPTDSATFCPKYSSLSYDERKQFWTFLLSSMVRFESNFKPETSFKESFTDSRGNNVISRGLLQLSIESGNAYGCGFKAAKDVHDPQQNLSCGIRILNRWVGRDGRIAGKVSGAWKGGARYWSVLRSTNNPYASITSWSKNISICK